MAIELTKEEVIECLDICDGDGDCGDCKLYGTDRILDRNDMACQDYLMAKAKEYLITETNKGEEKMAVAEKRTKEELLDEIKKLKGEVERLEKFKAYDNMAGEFKGMYDSYVNAGFTEDQAFQLIIKLIEYNASMNKRL